MTYVNTFEEKKECFFFINMMAKTFLALFLHFKKHLMNYYIYHNLLRYYLGT